MILPHNLDEVIAALKAGRLELKPVMSGNKLLFYAVVPTGQPLPDLPQPAQTDDRFPPTLAADPRRTKPL